MNEINIFTNKLQKSIPTHGHTGVLLCTYMAKQQSLVVVYSNQTHVCCFQLLNCNLNNMAIINSKLV